MRPRRRAFTIIELLIVIGILAILTAIILPVLWKARAAAMKVICSARLRDLTLATTMYQQQNRVYPQPMQKVTPGAGQATLRPAPQRISGDLLNQLRAYLTFPEVTSATLVHELPPFVQCPFVEGETDSRGPFVTASPDSSAYYTGYGYLGRLSEVAVATAPAPGSSLTSGKSPASPLGPLLPLPLPIQLPNLPLINGLLPVLEPGIELKPGRAADARQSKRALLWVDNVYQTDTKGPSWQYSHTRAAIRGRGSVLYKDPSELLGQHRAFTDGSVEWIKSGHEELQVDVQEPAQFDQKASLKTLLGEHWWF